ncbi:MAG: gluconokinase [Saprospiraceae bacterium]|nr:gluconokinase [Saprospiraceae bacterium]MCF8252207.1 gluconokinase [Saprospiraceae bacterium]MCF8282005.1 gluconokinase [Bacteroidales bacterium]MCF8311663.1 gluconokinase [Saprospiraceae bacterium]MCF8442582.1 gluconokinase [Saprospiraceae bacterium]
MTYFIGLDIGTSSTKAVAFDHSERAVGEVTRHYPTLSPKPDWQEQDPEQVVRAATSAVKKLVEMLGQAPASIALSAAMHSLIAVDGKGQPLTRSILWSDNRAASIASQLKGTPLGKDIYRHTGTPIHPMSPLPKIAWLRQHEPAIFQNTAKFLGIKEYLLFQLFGEFFTDQSMASATGLFDAARLDWHGPSLDFAGITPSQLPQHVSPFFTLGKIKPAAARSMGIPTEIPWVIGASDGCLANLGAGAMSPGEAVLSIGTSGALRITTHHPVYDPSERIFNYLLFPPTADQPATYVTGGASNNGAVVYEWFCRQFFGLSPSAKGMERHRAAMQQVPLGCDGLRFQPHILGERAPLWDAAATGSFQGIRPFHTLAHFHRAVLEGILWNMKAIGDVLEEVAGPYHVIFANGGFTKMPFWVEMAGEIFGKKIIVSGNEGGPALGAAMLGKRALEMEN